MDHTVSAGISVDGPASLQAWYNIRAVDHNRT